MSEKIKIGYAFCGSFCTFERSMNELRKLSIKYDVTPIFSYNASQIDTRFGKAEEIVKEAEEITGKSAILSITQAEPIGPKKMFEALVIAPVTGNTLSKLASNIVDTPVVMAAKSHLRNSRPLILAVSTNDALGASAKNIGLLLNTKNIYFVPMNQDDSKNKPRSMVADFELIDETIEKALKGEQIQPIIKG